MFLKFVEEMKEKLQNALPECTVSVNEIRKNNNTTRTVLSIFPKNSTVAPNIYLEDYYKRASNYDSNELFEILLKHVKEILNELPEAAKDTEKLCNFDKMKNRIFFNLINAEKNKDMLSSCPHILWNDLAIVFRGLKSMDDGEFSSFVITNNLANGWNISANELFDLASKNTPKLFPWKVAHMFDILANPNGDLPCEVIDYDEDEDMVMYVASNKNNVQGANVLLYPSLLSEFGKKCGKNFYILPSSIHEIILLPESDNTSADALKTMVPDVNSNDSLINREEILSNNVYYYDRDTCKVKIA